MQAETVNIVGLSGFPMVEKGDDLAKMIVDTAKKNNVSIARGDVVVVAQKVVSKAEGRVVTLKAVKPCGRAEEIAKVTLKDPRLVELVLNESKRIVKASPEVLVVEDERGLVSINAGIDKSNVSGEYHYALLPRDSDESARRIRSGIKKSTGETVMVIVCDTYSRPFRRGQTEFAIGVAGINVFKDYRGQKDLFDYELKVKNVAIVDEVACAAELVMGQGKEGVPVVIVKNLTRVERSEASSIEDLCISREEDLFNGAL